MDKERPVVLFLLCKRCGWEEEGREGEGRGGGIKRKHKARATCGQHNTPCGNQKRILACPKADQARRGAQYIQKIKTIGAVISTLGAALAYYCVWRTPHAG